jgi:lipopolysaccharide/colanic/teichoic acid biosynthesis glycosyltransferase
LRATHVDEFPQFFNILKGDLSFVGPRPERPEFVAMLEKEISFYDIRYLIKPGLTGWAQVNYDYGSTILDAKEKLQYDLYYISHRTITLDIGIIFKTVRHLF